MHGIFGEYCVKILLVGSFGVGLWKERGEGLQRVTEVTWSWTVARQENFENHHGILWYWAGR
jgi:hypothetical protein